jgi:cytochrome c553
MGTDPQRLVPKSSLVRAIVMMHRHVFVLLEWCSTCHETGTGSDNEGEQPQLQSQLSAIILQRLCAVTL